VTVHVEESIERYFEGAIAKREDRDALFGHLDRCEPCRDHFDRIAFTQRALAGAKGDVPATELALIRRTLIGGDSSRSRMTAARFFALFAPAAAVAAVGLLVVLNPHTLSLEPTFVPKGGLTLHSPQVEALCFDAAKEITAHLREDGACVAPGFVKVIYASPETVPSLVVAAIEDEEVRFVVKLESPKPRSVVPEFAELRPGASIRIIAVTAERAPEKESLLTMKPRLVVDGVSR
jgi:hypothetical protein